ESGRSHEQSECHQGKGGTAGVRVRAMRSGHAPFTPAKLPRFPVKGRNAVSCRERPLVPRSTGPTPHFGNSLSDRNPQEVTPMGVRLGAKAPAFTAQSTEGELRFHDWMGDKWAILFSHPKDFTPVCTTELGAVARLKPEFEKRNVKVIGLSVDGVKDHEGWSK